MTSRKRRLGWQDLAELTGLTPETTKAMMAAGTLPVSMRTRFAGSRTPDKVFNDLLLSVQQHRT